jgi:hypothetical protein
MPVFHRVKAERRSHAMYRFVICLSLLVAKDVGVTGIDDGHCGAPEELTASGAKLKLERSKHVVGTLQSLQRDFFSGLRAGL